jgi:hypothetical protein
MISSPVDELDAKETLGLLLLRLLLLVRLHSGSVHSKTQNPEPQGAQPSQVHQQSLTKVLNVLVLLNSIHCTECVQLECAGTHTAHVSRND